MSHIPPTQCSDNYALHADNIRDIISNMNSDDQICVLGDLNLSKVIWTMDPDNNSIFIPSNFKSTYQHEFTDSLMSKSLYQICRITNSNERSLDLAFANDCDGFQVHKSLDPFIKEQEHHCGLEVTIDYDEILYASIQQNINETFNFKQGNFDLLNDHLLNIDWSYLLDPKLDVNQQVDHFYNTIFNAFNLFVPKKKKRNESDTPPSWFNDELITLRNRKNRASRTYKKFPTVNNKRKFVNLHSEFNLKQNCAYVDFIQQVESNM